MAKKVKEINLYIRIQHWKTGKSYKYIGNLVNKSFLTVRNIMKRFEDEGKIENATERGRRKFKIH